MAHPCLGKLPHAWSDHLACAAGFMVSSEYGRLTILSSSRTKLVLCRKGYCFQIVEVKLDICSKMNFVDSREPGR